MFGAEKSCRNEGGMRKITLAKSRLRVVRNHCRKTDWKLLQRIGNTRLRSGFYLQELKH